MAETLSFISVTAFAAAAVCLMVTIIIFIQFRIPSVIEDLSGKTVGRPIEQRSKLHLKEAGGIKIKILEEIMFIHTEEEIR